MDVFVTIAFYVREALPFLVLFYVASVVVLERRQRIIERRNAEFVKDVLAKTYHPLWGVKKH